MERETGTSVGIASQTIFNPTSEIMYHLPILTAREAKDIPEFIKFWSAVYDYGKEHLYSGNIYKGELDSIDLRKLFEWKNGMPLSGKKEAVFQRIVERLLLVNELKAEMDEMRFSYEFRDLSAIWQIFLKHIIAPEAYPIFDQHVYRAHCYLASGYVSELSSYNPRKLAEYEQYRRFFEQLSNDAKDCNRKQIDEALWSFGKALKDSRPLLIASGLEISPSFLTAALSVDDKKEQVLAMPEVNSVPGVEKLEILPELQKRYYSKTNPDLLSVKFCRDADVVSLEVIYKSTPEELHSENLDFIVDGEDIDDMEAAIQPHYDIVDAARIFLDFDPYTLLMCYGKFFTDKAADEIANQVAASSNRNRQ